MPPPTSSMPKQTHEPPPPPRKNPVSKNIAGHKPPDQPRPPTPELPPKRRPRPSNMNEPLALPGPPAPPGKPKDKATDEQLEDVPPPPPPAPPTGTSRPSSPDSASEPESEPEPEPESESESEREEEEALRRSRRHRGSAYVSPDMVAPPPPQLPPPPPVANDNTDFMTLDVQNARWNVLRTGNHQVLKYSARLRSIFLWLPPATRWAKNQLVVERARNHVLNALENISLKIVDSLVFIRKAWESIGYVDDQRTKTPLPDINTNDDYWRWRFREGWEKNSNDLKMAQNAQHCNSILRSASNLLREYKNFIQGVQHKVEAARQRDPQAGLRLSKARIKQEILKKKMLAIKKQEEERYAEARKQLKKKDLLKSNANAKKRVKRLIMKQYHLKVKQLCKQVMDQRIQEHLDKEFEPGWRTSVEMSQSYIHALEHSIKLEQKYLARKRRQKAKSTYKKTLRRVRIRKKEQYGEKSHVFMRPLSRLVDIRGDKLRKSPIRPRVILHR